MALGDDPTRPRPTATRSAPAEPERPTPSRPGRGAPEESPRAPRLPILLGALVALLTLGALGVLATAQVTDVFGGQAVRWAAVVLSTGYGAALAARTGGRTVVSGALVLTLGIVAVLADNGVLLAGAAVVMGVVAAVLAVMATTPAPGYRRAVLEVLVAVVVAAGGALGVAGFTPDVSRDRLSYVVLALALAGAMTLVFRLGAGLHGLGRRGYVILLGGLVVLTVTLAYAEALRRWASPALRSGFEGFVTDVDAVLGAVPQPLEIALGFPALVWGVSMRARRRQGWWVCAFGVAATSTIAVSLVDASAGEAALALGYSLVPGLLLGYAVIRVDQFFTGPRGRRARQLEEASAHRPEPRRTRALL